MTRLFTAGGEESSLSAMWDLVTNYLDIDSMLFQFNESNIPSVSTHPRSGKGCYRLNDPTDVLAKDIVPSATEIYWGGAVYITAVSATPFLHFFTSNARAVSLNIRNTISGILEARRSNTSLGSSPAASFPLGQWNYIEVHYIPHNTTGVVQVKINGTQVINFSGDTTDGDAACWGFKITGINNASTKTAPFIDDIVLNDTNGTTNNTWPGQPHLIALRPAGAGSSTQMDRGGLDLGANWRNARNDSYDFAFIQSTDTGEKDLYAVETAVLPSGAIINNIITMARARVEAGSGFLQIVTDVNGTEVQGDSYPLGAGWKFYQQALATNPADSSAWEEADLANLQIGVEHSAT